MAEKVSLMEHFFVDVVYFQHISKDSFICNAQTVLKSLNMVVLQMKAHEESLSQKEKSTEEKAKETGRMPIQSVHIHLWPAEQSCRFSVVQSS